VKLDFKKNCKFVEFALTFLSLHQLFEFVPTFWVCTNFFEFVLTFSEFAEFYWVCRLKSSLWIFYIFLPTFEFYWVCSRKL